LNDGLVRGCINTNWVEPRGYHYGSIVGFKPSNAAIVEGCYYDNQMSIVGGTNNSDTIGSAEGWPTRAMLSGFLQLPFGYWEYHENLYPMVHNFYASQWALSSPVILLSAAPVYLYVSDIINYVRSPFYVSNHNWITGPYFLPAHRFQWSSDSGGSIVSIPLAPSNNATINNIGQDTLRVIHTDFPHIEKKLHITIR
jgi:hypothetical protein